MNEALAREIRKAARTRLEAALALQIRAAGLPAPETEYRFHPQRKWRADFCWPSLSWAVEVEGAVFSGGRHVTGAGFTADCEKYNALAIAGFRLLRFTAAQIEDGTAIRTLEEALKR